MNKFISVGALMFALNASAFNFQEAGTRLVLDTSKATLRSEVVTANYYKGLPAWDATLDLKDGLVDQIGLSIQLGQEFYQSGNHAYYEVTTEIVLNDVRWGMIFFSSPRIDASFTVLSQKVGGLPYRFDNFFAPAASMNTSGPMQGSPISLADFTVAPYGSVNAIIDIGNLSGGIGLLPSDDPDCASFSCMTPYVANGFARITVRPVPEAAPTTIALIGAALVMTYARSRRKKYDGDNERQELA